MPLGSFDGLGVGVDAGGTKGSTRYVLGRPIHGVRGSTDESPPTKKYLRQWDNACGVVKGVENSACRRIAQLNACQEALGFDIIIRERGRITRKRLKRQQHRENNIWSRSMIIFEALAALLHLVRK